MNIVTPLPTSAAAPTANLSTESARRDNALRETIPQTADPDQSASQQGLGSESDRARTPGQQPPALTYERPQVQSGNGGDSQPAGEGTKDNASDQSAGKDSAEDRQQQQQAEQPELDDLQRRDREVRKHEQAHAAVGGQYAGPPRYEYTHGPDGKRYITDGEVSIDVTEEKTPEQTLRKMEQVRSAAMAPDQPSAQDLRVAAEAQQKAGEARSEISKARAEAALSDNAGAAEPDKVAGQAGSAEREPFVSGDGEDSAALASATGNGKGREQREQASARTPQMAEPDHSRIRVIQRFYANSVSASEAGFRASA